MTRFVITALALFLTVVMTASAQLILKWQISHVEGPGEGPLASADWALRLLFSPVITLAFAAGLVAAISWFFVVSRVPIVWAYPFIALTFPMVVFGSAFLFGEPVGWRNVVALLLIGAGLVLNSS